MPALDTSGAFGVWWQLYPRKLGKPNARKAYDRALKSADAPDVLAGLARWVRFWIADATEARFIPHPTTFLNREQWNDPTPKPSAARTNEPRGFEGIREFLDGHDPASDPTGDPDGSDPDDQDEDDDQ